jgi:hypothetical protein
MITQENLKQINELVASALDERQVFNAFNPSLIPYHTHNGTDSPVIPFSGILGLSIISHNTNLSTEVVILADCSSVNLTLTLPTASGSDGRQYIIKDYKGKSSIHPITIQPTGTQTIDGASNKIINANYASFYVISNGANWSVL